MRQHELEMRQMEAAKIMDMLNQQQEKLESIIQSQKDNSLEMNTLFESGDIDIQQIENYKSYGLKLVVDEQNQQRIINNTKMLFEKKQEEVREAHKKAEVLKKLKEKQEQEFYKEFLDTEAKEIDDLTSARFNL